MGLLADTQLIEDINTSWELGAFLKADVDGATLATQLELDTVEHTSAIKEALASAHAILLAIAGVGSMVPEKMAVSIADKLKIDVSKVQELGGQLTSKASMASIMWQGILSGEKEVLDAFIQRFADYMIVYLKKEEVEIAKIRKSLTSIYEVVEELEAHLKVYPYGVIRKGLNDANAELNAALSYVTSALVVLSIGETPNLDIATEILGRYNNAQKILDNAFVEIDEKSKKFHIDWKLINEKTNAISKHTQDIAVSIGKIIIADGAVKNARWALVGLEEMVNATIGVAERYILENYLDMHRDALIDLVDSISQDLSTFKFEPRLLGTGLTTYTALEFMKLIWGGGSVAQAFSDNYQARATAVDFVNRISGHRYFADLDYVGAGKPVVEQCSGAWTIVKESAGNILKATDAAGGMFKATKAMIAGVDARFATAASSTMSFRSVCEAYGVYEDTTGTLDGLDTFFNSSLSITMVEFVLGVSGSLQLLNLFKTGLMPDDLTGAIFDPIRNLAKKRSKAIAQLAGTGSLAPTMAKALSQNNINQLEAASLVDLSITDCWAKQNVQMKDEIASGKENARIQGLNLSGGVA